MRAMIIKSGQGDQGSQYVIKPFSPVTRFAKGNFFKSLTLMSKLKFFTIDEDL